MPDGDGAVPETEACPAEEKVEGNVEDAADGKTGEASQVEKESTREEEAEEASTEVAPEGKKKEKKSKEPKDSNPAPRVQKNKTMDHIKDEELDWIWIGDADDARDAAALRKHNVRYILNCTPPRAEGGVMNFHEKDPNFSYCRLALGDNATEQLSTKFEDAWEFMERARIREDGGVLVHCQQGVSRSVSFAVSYLMKYYRKGFTEALALAKGARKQACPNEGFTRQLHELEEMLRRTNGYEKLPPKRSRPAAGGVGPAARPGAGPARGPAGPARGPAGPARGPAGPPRGPAGPSVGPTVGPSVGPRVGPSVGPSVGPARGPGIGPSMGPSPGPGAVKGPAKPPVGPAGPPAGEKRKAGPAVGPAVGPAKPSADGSKAKKAKGAMDLTS